MKIPPTLQRSLSLPDQPGPPPVPGIHYRNDTLITPDCSAMRTPGTLFLATHSPAAWRSYQCTPDSLIHRVEIQPHAGLINLIASPDFPLNQLTQTEKRELQGAVTAIVDAYNKFIDTEKLITILKNQQGQAFLNEIQKLNLETPALTIHENHLLSDAKIYQDADIPRRPNVKDYDKYHTLGAPFTEYNEQGKMLPHYHLEFSNKQLNFENILSIIYPLRMVGHQIAGRDIFSDADVNHLHDLVHEFSSFTQEDLKRVHTIAEMLTQSRARLPAELAAQRSQARDALHGNFIALASANTEQEKSPSLVNMHMNSFRPAEPLLECYRQGVATTLNHDFLRIEQLHQLYTTQPLESSQVAVSINELISIYMAFNRVPKELAKLDTPMPAEEYNEMLCRLHDGKNKIKDLVARQSPILTMPMLDKLDLQHEEQRMLLTCRIA